MTALRCPHCRGQLYIATVADDNGRQHVEITCLSCATIVASSLPAWSPSAKRARSKLVRRGS